MLCGFMALYNYQGPLAPRLSFCEKFTSVFYSLFISSFALHLIAERLASVAADTSFKVFGLTLIDAIMISPRLQKFMIMKPGDQADLIIFYLEFLNLQGKRRLNSGC